MLHDKRKHVVKRSWDALELKLAREFAEKQGNTMALGNCGYHGATMWLM